MKRFLSMALCFSLLLGVFAPLTAFAEEPSQKNIIRVGINAEYAPFEYIKDEKRGIYAGLDIDLMTFVGIEMGYDIEFVNMDFDALFNAVNNGTVDCAISTISYTEERDNVLDFCDPYMTAKVIYADEETVESYHVVFKEGAKNDPDSLYHKVNSTINELKAMGMVDTLIEKHDLTASDNDACDVILNINEDGTVELPEKEPVIIIPEEPKYNVTPWAENHVKRAQSLGWVRWGDFTTNITRGEFCSIVDRFLSSCGLNVSFFAMDTPFTDLDNDRAETWSIKYLYCLNIVEGKSETLFCPNDFLTREEAAVIFTRIIDCLHEFEVANIDTLTANDWAYNDHAHIADWAKNGVYTVSNLGIMQGTDNGFEPKKQLTYEEAVTMLIRLYDLRWSLEPTMFADKLNALMPDDENYMFSPLSVKMALMLTANGANDETKDEICEIFDEYGVIAYNKTAKKMIEKYSQADILTLDIANSIWVNKSQTDAGFDPDFESAAKEFYNGDVGTVDSTNAPDKINGWVNEKTNGKIKSIVPEDYTDFFAAIVNAIYFKGAWQNDFSEALTKLDKFTNADGNVVDTLFMNQTGYFNYYDDGVTKVIELPYKNTAVSKDEETGIITRDTYEDLDICMYIVMSENHINLEEKLFGIHRIYDFDSGLVKLSMPKFEVEYTDSLKDELSQLGFENIFDFGFDKLLKNEPLFVDDILHKTYIKVDEKGTEAAAVTVVGMMGSGNPQEMPEPIEFKADKPFYFVIRDNENGEILFMGRYAYAE